MSMGRFFEWQCIFYCFYSFFSGSNVPLDLWYILIMGSSVYIKACCFNWFLIHSNCLSERMCLILNTILWYVLITCWSDFIIVDFLSCFIVSVVPNHIAPDSLMMKGILLIYIISMFSVMLPCSSSIPSGRFSSVLSITLDSVFLLVLPVMHLRFGPSMSPALGKPCFVIGQFRITPLSMYTMYSLVVGLPIISCIQCALQALAYSSTVYFFLIESTVLIFTCTVSFLTSDKYKTFLEVINTWLVPSALWITNPVFIELLHVTLSFLWTLNKDRMLAMPSG